MLEWQIFIVVKCYFALPISQKQSDVCMKGNYELIKKKCWL